MAKLRPVRRFHYVDLLRGFAAMAVLVCHYRFFFVPNPADQERTLAVTLPGESWLWPLYKHGGQAVMLFWVLSGFVFWTAYGTRRIPASEFWVHRFARLYPLHFLTLCLMAVLEAVSWHTTGSWIAYGNNDLSHFAAQLFMGSNWFTEQTSFNGPIWSVSIEILVYFAFLAFLLRPSFALAVLLGAVAFKLDRYPLGMCAALFFWGVAIGMLAPKLQRRMLMIGLAGLALTAGVIGIWGSGTDRLLVYLGSSSLLMTFIGLDYRFTLPRQLRWFGLSTYSIYLLHIPVLVVLMLTIGIVPLPVFAGIVLALSVLSYKWIEAPSQNAIRAIGRDWLSRRRTVARAPL